MTMFRSVPEIFGRGSHWRTNNRLARVNLMAGDTRRMCWSLVHASKALENFLRVVDLAHSAWTTAAIDVCGRLFDTCVCLLRTTCYPCLLICGLFWASRFVIYCCVCLRWIVNIIYGQLLLGGKSVTLFCHVSVTVLANTLWNISFFTASKVGMLAGIVTEFWHCVVRIRGRVCYWPCSKSNENLRHLKRNPKTIKRCSTTIEKLQLHSIYVYNT